MSHLPCMKGTFLFVFVSVRVWPEGSEGEGTKCSASAEGVEGVAEEGDDEEGEGESMVRRDGEAALARVRRRWAIGLSLSLSPSWSKLVMPFAFSTPSTARPDRTGICTLIFL